MFWTGASLFSEACRLTRHQEALFGDSFIEVFFADSFVVGVLDLFSKDWERLHRR
jgi:hypothetical protein